MHVINHQKHTHIFSDLPAPSDLRVLQNFESRVQLIWKRIDFEGHNSDHFLTYQVNVYDDQGNLAANDLLYHNSSSPYSEVNLDNYLYTWINNLTPGRFYNASVQVAVCFEIHNKM